MADEDTYALITRLDPDTGERQLFAKGVRNTLGFDWHPETGVLWFTDNGRDWLGDNRPPDELNRAPKAGLHFGFPFCHGRDLPDPEYGHRRDCGDLTPPVLELGPHVAALGMRFYTADRFPKRYRGGIFIAEHGSWNRSTPIGYRVRYRGDFFVVGSGSCPRHRQTHEITPLDCEIGEAPRPRRRPPCPASGFPVTAATYRRGRERFDIYCAPCHSVVGDGDGMVVRCGFPAPPSYHTDRLRGAPDRHFYAVITRGYGVMYSYADASPPTGAHASNSDQKP